MRLLLLGFGLAGMNQGLFAQDLEASPAAAVVVPGRQGDGSILLPNQWSLRPVGRQIGLGDFPVNIAVHPDSQYAAVLHCGYGQHEIIVVDVTAGRVISRAPVDESFYGLAFSPDGKQLFASGAAGEVIHQFDFEDGYLSHYRTIRLREEKEVGIPAGLALDAKGSRLYVANVLGHRLTAVDLDEAKPVWETTLGTNALEFARPDTPRNPDVAAITKRAEALLERSDPADPFPYGCVVDDERGRLYVSLWAQSAVAVLDLKSHGVVARWRTEQHPNEMLLSKSGRQLFVANANRNTVSVFDTETGRSLEVLAASLQPDDPPGATPNSLALSPDGRLLFVANANINTVAVFDVSQPGKSRSLGFIPVGWYPTSVRVTPDGKRLLVANGKGLMSKANRNGPQPGREPPSTVREYIAGLFRGTLSIINLPSKEEQFEQQLKRFTAQALGCRPQPAKELTEEDLAGNPVPIRPGEPSPIRYCLYIIKENRTYDQVLGDLREGNGDPTLCLFPERVTPNHHKLAREFVLLDNFYVESEVSADGHEWSMGAYADDFVEKTWPLNYGHNQRGKYTYPSEGRFVIAEPAGGYLWDCALEAGVSYRSYGEFVDNGKTPDDPATTRLPALQGHFDPHFRSFDMNYPDAQRADRFISELKRFDAEGEMPRLQILRLPSDHTAGTAAGHLTPTAHLADNDVALGRVVEAVSRTRFWPRTAIFVVEDDAQNGPDHVDAHRTVAFVISPYARRRAVDSSLYSTTSMLRTMELILGLRAMSQFDAAALPMCRSFQAKADAAPYEARPANVDLNERNQQTAWGAKQSGRMDFTREDAADDLQLNEVIWRSVRGADQPMPAPRRAAFVFVHPKAGAEDDDD